MRDIRTGNKRDEAVIGFSHFADAALLRACSMLIAALQIASPMRPFNLALCRQIWLRFRCAASEISTRGRTCEFSVFTTITASLVQTIWIVEHGFRVSRSNSNTSRNRQIPERCRAL